MNPFPFGFARRVAVVFALVGLLLAWLGVQVSLLVEQMHTHVDRVVEEHREAAYSRDMLHALEILEARVALLQGAPPDVEQREILRTFALEAQAALATLARGPGEEDPSRKGHLAQEARLYAELEGEMEGLSQAIDAGAPDLHGKLQRVRKHARGLNREMSAEAVRSSSRLRSAARSVRGAVLWTTASALVLLLCVLWMVWRFVVRPVEALRAGAGRIAGGDLSHRVVVRTRDELGALASEFNSMAGQLHAMRTDLEARVEERTREFLRAARLAGLGTMAAGIAHEINNPLASIASCAEGLERRLGKDGLTPEDLREYLQIIAQEAYRAHEITSRLLEFAHGEGGPKTVFSIAEMLRGIELLLEHRLRERGLRLQLECDPALPPMEGNPGECKQVLLNLIHNAIDASPAGGLVRVACRRRDGEAHLEVEDQGAGVPPDHLERIFDPFFTTKAPGKGTGLGLAIVHRIVEAHGGRLEVENTGHGALFRVRIPLAP